MRITDPEAIAQAELKLAEVQSALDEVRRVLRTVEKVERTAQRGRGLVRPLAIVTVGGVAVLVVGAVRRKAGSSDG